MHACIRTYLPTYIHPHIHNSSSSSLYDWVPSTCETFAGFHKGVRTSYNASVVLQQLLNLILKP